MADQPQINVAHLRAMAKDDKCGFKDEQLVIIFNIYHYHDGKYISPPSRYMKDKRFRQLVQSRQDQGLFSRSPTWNQWYELSDEVMRAYVEVCDELRRVGVLDAGNRVHPQVRVLLPGEKVIKQDIYQPD